MRFAAHWPLALLAAIALPLIFIRLGAERLWEDEGDTAVLASSIVKFGVPKAWDGVTFTDSDRGARVNDAMIMVSHPWLQYYAAATAFVVFGESAFAARLPFALAGWLTVLTVYALVWRLVRNRVAAFAAAALLLANVQFLLYCRQSRYYSLTMLITCVALWAFFEMKSFRGAALFAGMAILLFHTHPLAVLPIISLGLLTLLAGQFREQRLWFWLSMPVVVLLTAPWLLIATRGYGEGAQLATGIAQFAARFVQASIELSSVTPLIGICLLAAATRWRGKLDNNTVAYLLILLLTALLDAFILALMQSTNVLWYHGLRYAAVLLPIAAVCAGMLIAQLARGRIIVWLSLLVVLALTKLGQITPWLSWTGDGRMPFGRYVIAAHLPPSFWDRWSGNGLAAYVHDIVTPNPGTIAGVCDFLETYASRDDVLVSNYGWEPIYFHTRLPQAWKILPRYPIMEAARRRGLPDYVFSVDHPRWVLWRPYWDGYLDYFFSDVEQQITSNGGHLQPVAEFDETIWENRENIHFHRFAGGVYLFERPERSITGARTEAIEPARLFRVDW